MVKLKLTNKQFKDFQTNLEHEQLKIGTKTNPKIYIERNKKLAGFGFEFNPYVIPEEIEQITKD